jgi:hypothetical protein
VARHNREGTGSDQHGFTYTINYPPDWMRCAKIARTLESGRRSTVTLFRNPSNCRKRLPGDQVRTRISSPEQGIDVEVAIRADADRVGSFSVSCEAPAVDGPGVEEVTFTIVGGLDSDSE